MPVKRMRAEIWVSLQPKLTAEAERSGLSINEIVNMVLADYFGLSPKGRVQGMSQPNLTPSAQPQTVDDEDYI